MMPEPFIEIDASELIRYLDRVSAVKPDFQDLEPVIDAAREMGQHYPPEPAGSKYVRTGTLFGSYQKLVSASEMALMSTAEYVKYVVGAYQVRWMRRAGWINIPENIDDAIRRAMDRIVQKVMRRLE